MILRSVRDAEEDADAVRGPIPGRCHDARLRVPARRLGTRLLTAALLSPPEGIAAEVRGLTAEQQRALDVGITAGLQITNAGYVCLRGMRSPTPYLPSGAFL